MSQTDQYRRAEAGLTAQTVLAQSRGFIHQQEVNIVSRLVSSYRGNKLSTEQLWAGLGEIAGLRGLLNSLESTARSGQDAQQEIRNG